jgi:hypothetical protein
MVITLNHRGLGNVPSELSKVGRSFHSTSHLTFFCTIKVTSTLNHSYLIDSRSTSPRTNASTCFLTSTKSAATQLSPSLNLHTSTCRHKNPTRHNRASLLHVQHAISNISDTWVEYRAFRAHRHQFRRTRRGVRAWKRDMRGFRCSCQQLLQTYKTDLSIVTLGDWDKTTASKESKLQITYGTHYTGEKWPATIPYLNHVAYAKYCAIRNTTRAARKARKAAILKKTAEAAVRKVEASAKHTEALKNDTNIAGTLPWRDPIALQAFFEALEHRIKQMESQIELLRRSCRNATSVSFEQWQAATEGAVALESGRTVSCYIELARHRKMGKQCDGWVFGRCFAT